ncbi:hypothetical protein BU23DRAFT_631482 [Bimuria novae-zelandiae CBS 107.79]|uniref:Uncharacterized protein n=1 Tax=Bimuria novae-zelandiae CBS 107.79 TaxID=1447943 RepID=A0A6A5VHD3_9PLEO|nr:hypothetical protein BU23DRAFT_631482 [Bimuria novae-zelandiae CBS 107.79]
MRTDCLDKDDRSDPETKNTTTNYRLATDQGAVPMVGTSQSQFDSGYCSKSDGMLEEAANEDIASVISVLTNAKRVGSAASKAESVAKDFVRQQRNRITQQLREIHNENLTSEDEEKASKVDDGMSLEEKKAHWRRRAEQDMNPDAAEILPSSEDEVLPERYDQFCSTDQETSGAEVLELVQKALPAPNKTCTALIQLDFEFIVKNSSDSSQSEVYETHAPYWHAMFHSPVIADGFPILAREQQEKGLKLPFSMMIELAGAQTATEYDESLKWMPYYAFNNQCRTYINNKKLKAHGLQHGSFHHFFGWTTSVTRHFGTKDVSYSSIDWAGARKCSAGFAIEQKLAVSASKIVGASCSFVRGNRDKPEFIRHSTYSMQIDYARSMVVTLYDTSFERDWVADGASALLYLTLTSVTQKGYNGTGSAFEDPELNSVKFQYPNILDGLDAAVQALTKECSMKHVILSEFDSYTETWALPPRGI